MGVEFFFATTIAVIISLLLFRGPSTVPLPNSYHLCRVWLLSPIATICPVSIEEEKRYEELKVVTEIVFFL